MSFLRLDGSTPSSKRQELVDAFNRSPSSTTFAFLLSAKAGGMGINLIGASRLVLFDIDWNPATDAQAMARIHRDGQKRPCYIYRLLMAGGLDEKIWQRQVTKIGLASSVMDQKSGTSSFSRDDLKDLFRLDDNEHCQTHELIDCSCGGRGMPEEPQEQIDRDAECDSTHSVGGEEEEEDDMDVWHVPSLNEDSEGRSSEKKGPVGKAAEESKLQSLMAFSHIDTAKCAEGDLKDFKSLVQDEILSTILKEEENKISFIFAKMSG
jgi:DNA repair and recombination protein RAD54B